MVNCFLLNNWFGNVVPFQGCASSPKIYIYKPETLEKELKQVEMKDVLEN